MELIGNIVKIIFDDNSSKPAPKVGLVISESEDFLYIKSANEQTLTILEPSKTEGLPKNRIIRVIILKENDERSLKIDENSSKNSENHEENRENQEGSFSVGR